ncbi:unnamed protein product [Kuraishia capsulata CBS 1993]|uniref:Uncharacterized protein n=1 Tax=Kuraishia capsulata CBS 1993 TaxID=1382522 RepID=W6MUW1_9ASCO|nr:uncharacterized protein KUCA_T00001921001 [Kuraishia capsulata CBS 1993]CDK25950.1 unnamed protein product [Kuraishia capsulata CBS 1993]
MSANANLPSTASRPVATGETGRTAGVREGVDEVRNIPRNAQIPGGFPTSGTEPSAGVTGASQGSYTHHQQPRSYDPASPSGRHTAAYDDEFSDEEDLSKDRESQGGFIQTAKSFFGRGGSVDSSSSKGHRKSASTGVPTTVTSSSPYGDNSGLSGERSSQQTHGTTHGDASINPEFETKPASGTGVSSYIPGAAALGLGTAAASNKGNLSKHYKDVTPGVNAPVLNENVVAANDNANQKYSSLVDPVVSDREISQAGNLKKNRESDLYSSSSNTGAKGVSQSNNPKSVSHGAQSGVTSAGVASTGNDNYTTTERTPTGIAGSNVGGRGYKEGVQDQDFTYGTSATEDSLKKTAVGAGGVVGAAAGAAVGLAASLGLTGEGQDQTANTNDRRTGYNESKSGYDADYNGAGTTGATGVAGTHGVTTGTGSASTGGSSDYTTNFKGYGDQRGNDNSAPIGSRGEQVSGYPHEYASTNTGAGGTHTGTGNAAVAAGAVGAGTGAIGVTHLDKTPASQGTQNQTSGVYEGSNTQAPIRGNTAGDSGYSAGSASSPGYDQSGVEEEGTPKKKGLLNKIMGKNKKDDQHQTLDQSKGRNEGHGNAAAGGAAGGAASAAAVAGAGAAYKSHQGGGNLKDTGISGGKAAYGDYSKGTGSANKSGAHSGYDQTRDLGQGSGQHAHSKQPGQPTNYQSGQQEIPSQSHGNQGGTQGQSGIAAGALGTAGAAGAGAAYKSHQGGGDLKDIGTSGGNAFYSDYSKGKGEQGNADNTYGQTGEGYGQTGQSGHTGHTGQTGQTGYQTSEQSGQSGHGKQALAGGALGTAGVAGAGAAYKAHQGGGDLKNTGISGGKAAYSDYSKGGQDTSKTSGTQSGTYAQQSGSDYGRGNTTGASVASVKNAPGAKSDLQGRNAGYATGSENLGARDASGQYGSEGTNPQYSSHGNANPSGNVRSDAGFGSTSDQPQTLDPRESDHSGAKGSGGFLAGAAGVLGLGHLVGGTNSSPTDEQAGTAGLGNTGERTVESGNVPVHSQSEYPTTTDHGTTSQGFTSQDTNPYQEYSQTSKGSTRGATKATSKGTSRGTQGQFHEVPEVEEMSARGKNTSGGQSQALGGGALGAAGVAGAGAAYKSHQGGGDLKNTGISGGKAAYSDYSQGGKQTGYDDYARSGNDQTRQAGGYNQQSTQQAYPQQSDEKFGSQPKGSQGGSHGKSGLAAGALGTAGVAGAGAAYKSQQGGKDLKETGLSGGKAAYGDYSKNKQPQSSGNKSGDYVDQGITGGQSGQYSGNDQSGKAASHGQSGYGTSDQYDQYGGDYQQTSQGQTQGQGHGGQALAGGALGAAGVAGAGAAYKSQQGGKDLKQTGLDGGKAAYSDYSKAKGGSTSKSDPTGRQSQTYNQGLQSSGQKSSLQGQQKDQSASTGQGKQGLAAGGLAGAGAAGAAGAGAAYKSHQAGGNLKDTGISGGKAAYTDYSKGNKQSAGAGQGYSQNQSDAAYQSQQGKKYQDTGAYQEYPAGTQGKNAGLTGTSGTDRNASGGYQASQQQKTSGVSQQNQYQETVSDYPRAGGYDSSALGSAPRGTDHHETLVGVGAGAGAGAVGAGALANEGSNNPSSPSTSEKKKKKGLFGLGKKKSPEPSRYGPVQKGTVFQGEPAGEQGYGGGYGGAATGAATGAGVGAGAAGAGAGSGAGTRSGYGAGDADTSKYGGQQGNAYNNADVKVEPIDPSMVSAADASLLDAAARDAQANQTGAFAYYKNDPNLGGIAAVPDHQVRSGGQGAQGAGYATQSAQGGQGTGYASQGTKGSQSGYGTQGTTKGTQTGYGTQGTAGDYGTQGGQTTGYSSQGTKGSRGDQGTQSAGYGTQRSEYGTQGTKGTRGNQGLQNAEYGTQGDQTTGYGTQGTKGTRGTQGTQGAGYGSQGTQNAGYGSENAGYGSQGTQNAQGAQGTRGAGNNASGSQYVDEGAEGPKKQGLVPKIKRALKGE